jgi:1,2-diacylglycerol 3-alpha-glucosyltransferase
MLSSHVAPMVQVDRPVRRRQTPPDSATPLDSGRDFERIGILNDHLRVSYANGSSFASQLLHREFVRRGYEVTLLGPMDPRARPSDLPPHHIAFWSRELRNHPGVFVPFPSVTALERAASKRFDVVLGQTCSALLELGTWLRQRHGVPYLCVNTLHLPSAYNVLLPDQLHASERVREFFDERLIPTMEASTARAYNASDGLIVLSEGMRRYWLARGVKVPIFTIPRSIEPRVFDRAPGEDPFDPRATRGGRLLVVCRHTREKGLERLLNCFATHIAPQHAAATLTLVGDGPDHDGFRRLSERLGVQRRVFFSGEQPLTRVPDYYRHADVFVYASESDTYGQVVSEAAWCGLPCVGIADGMGVSHQVTHGKTGFLAEASGGGQELARQFAEFALVLLRDTERRLAMGSAAATAARWRAAPERSVERYLVAFADARGHLREAARESKPGRAELSLAQWAALHVALLACGYLRRPVTVNRNRSVHPGWSESLET